MIILMDIGKIWLDGRQLKLLRREIENIGSADVKRELDIYNDENGCGGYLCNVLCDDNLEEISFLMDKFGLMSLPTKI